MKNDVGPISPGIAHKILQLAQNNSVAPARKQPIEKEKIFFNLTEREQEILKLLVQGLLYKEIGNQLQISPNTAKKHAMNIYSKLHVNNKVQDLALAQEKGLISLLQTTFISWTALAQGDNIKIKMYHYP